MIDVHTEERNGLTIQIVIDEDPQNPLRDFDSDLVTVACFHRDYDLGTDHGFSSPDEVWEHVRETKAVFLPLYLYDHSGITMSTAPFSCPWDSGMVGIAFIEREKILREWGHKILTKKDKSWAKEFIEVTIRTYDQYLTGQVYGFIVEDEDGDHVDSCFGFFGDLDEVLEEARGAADYHVEQKRLSHFARLKAWIANRVPLAARVPCPA